MNDLALHVTNEALWTLSGAIEVLGENATAEMITEVAWHYRQRDAVHAAHLSELARARLLCPSMAPASNRGVLARLELIGAERCFLAGRFEEAEVAVRNALKQFETSADLRGCCDAQILHAQIMTDIGDLQRRDTAWTAATELALRLDDRQRHDLAELGRAKWSVFRGAAQARVTWGAKFSADSQPADPAVRAWREEFWASIAIMEGDLMLALRHYTEAASCAEHTGQMHRMLMLHVNISVCFNNVNDHESALECLESALETARARQVVMGLVNALLQTAYTLRCLGEPAAARTYLAEVFENLRDHSKTRTYVIAMQYQGEVDLAQEKFLSALAGFREMERCAHAHGSADLHANAFRLQADVLSRLGQHKDALAAAKQALEMIRKLGMTPEEIETLLVIAEVHDRAVAAGAVEGSTEQALQCLQEATSLGVSLENMSLPGDLYDAMARAHARNADYASAFSCALQAAAAREKTHTRNAFNRGIAIQIRHQADRVAAAARHQHELAQIEAQRARALERQNATLSTIALIGQEISAQLNTETLCRTLSRHVHALVDASSFSVFLLDDTGEFLDCAFGVDDGKLLPPLRVELSDPASNLARSAREATFLSMDFAGVNATSTLQIPAGTSASQSALYAPLTSSRGLIGVLSIQSVREHAYGEREKAIFFSLCAYAAISLDHAIAYKELENSLASLREAQAELIAHNTSLESAGMMQAHVSLTDPLTGMLNRHFLSQHMRQISTEAGAALDRRDTRHASDPDQMYAMVFFMIDIDYFKQVNDQFGHAAGDRLLILMHQRLQRIARTGDHLVRWGGEEFLLVSHHVPVQIAAEIAERIRSVIALQPFDLGDGVTLSKTCSIGYMPYEPRPAATTASHWAKAVELADRALYRAKHAGRNRWVGLSHANGKSASADGAAWTDLDTAIANGDINVCMSDAVDATASISTFSAVDSGQAPH